MPFDLVSDRNVCTYLDTRSFVMFRIVCRTHYDDMEAWALRASCGVLCVPSLNKRTNIGTELPNAVRIVVRIIDWFC